MMPTIFLKDTIATLHQLHLTPSNLFLAPIFNYEHEHAFVLNKTMFTQALTTTAHLSLGGFFGMVYEHLSGCFIPEDPSLGFLELIQVATIVARGDIHRLVALVLWINILMAMAKDTSGLRLVVVGKVFF